MTAAWRASAAACAALLLPACGSAQPSGALAATTSAPEQKQAPAAVPSGWDYHPKRAARLRARLTLPDGRWLLAGDGGERWLSDPAAGTATAAPTLAGEDLIAIATLPSGGFGFIGEAGTLHVARDPIGPFDEIVRSDPAVVQVHGHGDKLIGVHADGTLVRSTDAGRSFVPMRYEGGRVFDAAVAADGRTLLLAAPEQLWASLDGQAFERRDTGGLGVFQVGLDPGGNPAARAIRGGLLWRSGSKELQPSTLVPFTSDYDLLTDPLPGASAAALASGAAAVVGADYFGAVEPAKEGGRWSLAVGGLLGRAHQVVPVEGSEECGRMLVTASQQQVVIACLARSKGSQSLIMPRVKVIVASRPGLVFESRATNVVAEEHQARVRLLPDGSVLTTGMCRPGNRRICQVGAPIRLSIRHAGGVMRVDADEPATAPPMAVQAPGAVISPDGRKIYLGARLLEPRKLALLVSSDGGKKFEPVFIDASRISLGEGVDSEKTLESAVPNQIGIDSEGNVSLVVASSAGLLWLVSDRDGRMGSSAVAPPNSLVLATAGRHALAWSGAQGLLRASHDAGASFPQTIRIPEQMLRGNADGVVACVAEGCAISDTFSWQGWSTAPAGLPDSARAQAAKPDRHLRVPIACKAEEEWKTISGADQAPSAFEMDRNGTAWTAVINDYESGRVSYAMARSVPDARVETLTLLEPLQGEASAIAIRPQAEGVAVLRYGVQRDPEGDVNLEGPLRNIDVRWVDLWSPGIKRSKIPAAGSMSSSEVSMERPDRFTASIGLLSVGSDGIFACPHDRCTGPEAGAFFLDPAGRSQHAWVPAWPPFPWGDRLVEARTEMIRADKQDVPIAFMPGNSAVLRARKVDAATRFDAMTLVPAAAEAQGWFARVSWAMSKVDPVTTCAVTVAHPDKPSAYAKLLRFKASQPGVAEVLPAPMLSEAGEPPRACSAQDRATTHRIVSPVDGGRRHPVRVQTGAEGESEWLLSDEATIYGKPGEGCVSMLHAARWAGAGPALTAIVDLTNPERSWLFTTEGEGGNELRWKSMRCAFDRTARPPEKLTAASPP